MNDAGPFCPGIPNWQKKIIRPYSAKLAERRKSFFCFLQTSVLDSRICVLRNYKEKNKKKIKTSVNSLSLVNLSSDEVSVSLSRYDRVATVVTFFALDLHTINTYVYLHICTYVCVYVYITH